MNASEATNALVLGSGRSGTTWIADALAEPNHMGVVFEPLHPVMGEVAEHYAYGYLNAQQQATALREYLQQAFDGRLPPVWARFRTLPQRVSPHWSMLFSPRKAKALVRRYRKWQANKKRFQPQPGQSELIKLIRANLMDDWLLQDPSVRLLCVVRHPGAVVESRMRLDRAALAAGLGDGTDDWNPDARLNAYLANRDLMQSRFAHIADLGKLLDHECARHAALWCIENVGFLARYAGEREPHARSLTVLYEQLLGGEPGQDAAWARVAQFLNLTVVPDAQIQTRPSQQASDDFASGVAHARWMSRLSDEQKQHIDAVLQAFGIRTYCCADARPQVNELHAPNAAHSNANNRGS